MADFRPLSAVQNAGGFSDDDYKGWNRRGLLSLAKPVGKGVGRQLTRDEALEVSLLAALRDCGIDPRIGADMVANWVCHWPGDWFFANPVTGEHVFASDTGAASRIDAMMGLLPDETEGALDGEPGSSDDPRPASRITVAHLAEIRRRVDDLFRDQ